jgi:hypothetical protein
MGPQGLHFVNEYLLICCSAQRPAQEGIIAQEEIILATIGSEARSNETKARAEASFKKEERAKEGAKAMLEYLANGREIRQQMARLRALRLAKEAQEAQASPAQEPQAEESSDKVRKPAVRRKRAKSSLQHPVVRRSGAVQG